MDGGSVPSRMSTRFAVLLDRPVVLQDLIAYLEGSGYKVTAFTEIPKNDDEVIRVHLTLAHNEKPEDVTTTLRAFEGVTNATISGTPVALG